MTTAQRRYIGTEALIGAVISAVLSVAFILMIFGKAGQVSVHSLIADALPQGFFIGFMATVVPTVLTRRRLARGTVGPIAGPSTLWPAAMLLRALLVGVLAAAIGAALTTVLLTTGVTNLPLVIVLIGKALWGALLGGFIAVTMTRIAMLRG